MKKRELKRELKELNKYVEELEDEVDEAEEDCNEFENKYKAQIRKRHIEGLAQQIKVAAALSTFRVPAVMEYIAWMAPWNEELVDQETLQKECGSLFTKRELSIAAEAITGDCDYHEVQTKRSTTNV